VSGGQRTAGGSLVELAVIVAVALGLALAIQAFVVKPYRIPSGSMLPTLKIGERVLVSRVGHRLGGDPVVGDVVVFHPPAGAEGDTCGDRDRRPGQACDRPTRERAGVTFIKRVVGLPGDVIVIRGGHVIRNGRREGDGYISRTCDGSDGTGCTFATPIRVPAAHFFMMGDNRGESDDSRFWGPVPRAWIVGGAFASYWPLKRVGVL
jgi:signal peptidase I